MKAKYIKLAVLASLCSVTLFSCGGGSGEDPVPPEPDFGVKNPLVINEIKENSETIKLSAPFTIYTEDGETPTGLKYQNKPVESNSFTDLYKAIRIAGENSTAKNKLQVQDANFTRVFIRQKASTWHVFDGHDYVGFDVQNDAKAYVVKHPKSYAISGDGSGYKYLGRSDYSENMDLYEPSLELNAGAYNYMFSVNGVGKGEGGTNLNGFSYATANVRLSEMTYKPTKDGDGWNAYIFINLAANNHSDLGLIGNVIGNKLKWRMVRNCGSKVHGSAGFSVYHDKVVTESTKYDPATNTYSGCDDLRFEAIGLTNGWILNITNLRTKEVHSFEDLHYDENGNPVVENPVDKACYHRALIASSYCPVVGNVWNWDCGASLNNVVWDNIQLTRYIDDNVESYRKDDVERYEFFPDSELLRDGYSQGAFTASHEFGVRESDGTYKSGETYKKGDKFLSQSVNYTNSWN